MIFSVPAGHPKGDIPALGRLTINEAQAVDQWWLTWGCETNDDYTHTDSSGSGALLYEAESRTALGGSATAVGPSGASGGGSNVMRNTGLATDFVSILSTQATGGGAHLSHVGSFRVYARFQAPTSNTGTVTVGLEWGVGDFRRFTRNDSTTLDPIWEGTWRLVDLGLVTVPKVLTGLQRWEGRIIAKSTVTGDDIDVDHMFLVPVGTASGIVSGVVLSPSPTSIQGQDDFASLADEGALNTRTAPVGGTWATSGAAGDFLGESTSGPAVIDRASSGERYAILGSTNYTTQTVSVDIAGTLIGRQGAIGHWVDSSNFAMGIVEATTLKLIKKVTGTETVLASTTEGISGGVTRVAISFPGSDKAIVTAYNGTSVVATLTANDSVFSTGGALDDGKPGIIDAQGADGSPRGYDNFLAVPLVTDAAVFASQSLEVRYDGAIREDSAGAIWQPVSSYEGDFLKVPVTGREGRSTRFIVKACRNDPATGPDSGIDDINATLAVTPRYLSVPAPA